MSWPKTAGLWKPRRGASTSGRSPRPDQMPGLPKVALIFTGGTIESVGQDRLDLAWYIENNKRLTNQEVLDRIPELSRIADVREVPFRKLPSHALVDRDWIDLVGAVEKALAEGADGVVMTH